MNYTLFKINVIDRDRDVLIHLDNLDQCAEQAESWHAEGIFKRIDVQLHIGLSPTLLHSILTDINNDPSYSVHRESQPGQAEISKKNYITKMIRDALEEVSNEAKLDWLLLNIHDTVLLSDYFIVESLTFLLDLHADLKLPDLKIHLNKITIEAKEFLQQKFTGYSLPLAGSKPLTHRPSADELVSYFDKECAWYMQSGLSHPTLPYHKVRELSDQISLCLAGKPDMLKSLDKLAPVCIDIAAIRQQSELLQTSLSVLADVLNKSLKQWKEKFDYLPRILVGGIYQQYITKKMVQRLLPPQCITLPIQLLPSSHKSSGKQQSKTSDTILPIAIGNSVLTHMQKQLETVTQGTERWFLRQGATEEKATELTRQVGVQKAHVIEKTHGKDTNAVQHHEQTHTLTESFLELYGKVVKPSWIDGHPTNMGCYVHSQPFLSRSLHNHAIPYGMEESSFSKLIDDDYSYVIYRHEREEYSRSEDYSSIMICQGVNSKKLAGETRKLTTLQQYVFEDTDDGRKNYKEVFLNWLNSIGTLARNLEEPILFGMPLNLTTKERKYVDVSHSNDMRYQNTPKLSDDWKKITHTILSRE